MLLTPAPVTNCHTFSDFLPPLERDILYGWQFLKVDKVFKNWESKETMKPETWKKFM